MIRAAQVIGVTAAVLTGWRCSPAAPGGRLSDGDSAAIARLRAAYVAAELKGDRGAQAALYAADAVLLEPDAPVFEGRRAIRTGLEESDAVLSGFSLTSLEIGGGRSGAFDRGVYHLEYRDYSTGATASDSGNYLMVLRRQGDSTWRIVLLIHNPMGLSSHATTPGGR